jgi:hypothetical protein
MTEFQKPPDRVPEKQPDKNPTDLSKASFGEGKDRKADSTERGEHRIESVGKQLDGASKERKADLTDRADQGNRGATLEHRIESLGKQLDGGSKERKVGPIDQGDKGNREYPVDQAQIRGSGVTDISNVMQQRPEGPRNPSDSSNKTGAGDKWESANLPNFEREPTRAERAVEPRIPPKES